MKKFITKKNLIILFVILVALGFLGYKSSGYNEKADMYLGGLNEMGNVAWFYSKPESNILSFKIFFITDSNPIGFLNGEDLDSYTFLSISVIGYDKNSNDLIILQQEDSVYESEIKEFSSSKGKEISNFFLSLDPAKDLTVILPLGEKKISSKEIKAIRNTLLVYYNQAEKLYSTR